MKYAILDSGGKQYIAREGETIEVDRLPLEVGKPVEFKEILLVADNGKVAVGTPTVKGATVKGRILDHIRAAKIIVFKYVPKQRYRRKQGHRQHYTRVAIEAITHAAPAAKKAEPKAEKDQKPAAKAKAKPAEKKVDSVAKPAAKKKEPAPKASTAKSTAKKAGKSAATKKAAPKKSSSKSTKAAPKKSAGSSTKKPASKKSSTKKK